MTSDNGEALEGAELVLAAVPSAFLRETLAGDRADGSGGACRC